MNTNPTLYQNHYRVTVNGDTGNVLLEMPKSWNEMAYLIEQRGAHAKLERRTVATGDLSDLHVWDGWMHLGDGTAFTSWECIAELDFRSPVRS